MSAEKKILMAAVALPAGAIMAMGGLLAGTTAVTPPCTSASPSPSTSMSGSASPAPPGSTPPAGLNLTPDQWAIVQTTATVATAKGVANSQALTAIFAAGLVESGLQNLPYGDRDSLGVWQERPSAGWGTPAQILDVAYAAGIWFDHMLAFADWQTMAPGDLAQAVEVSAYPDRYAARVPEAAAIAAAVLGGDVPTCTPGTTPIASGNAAVAWAEAHLGIPYVWGGTGPDGYDCSGYVQAAWAAAGVTLPRTAAAQMDGTAPIPAGSEQPGDLAFPTAEIGVHGAGHVEIVVTPASTGAGILVSEAHTGTVSSNSTYTDSGFVFGRP